MNTTPNTIWIDEIHPGQRVGDMGFLVRIAHLLKGSGRFDFRDYPPKTNMSYTPRPRGWCGTSNDVSTHGMGVWRVIEERPNGRIKLQEVTDRDELVAFLDEVGFPDLLEACMPSEEG